VDAAVRHVLWCGVTCHLADAGDEQCLSVDTAVRHVLWCGVTCHLADAGDEQCLRCGCSSRSCTVVLCAADVLTVTSISKVIRQKAASLPLRSTFSSGLFDLDRSLIHGFSGQHERVHVCGSSGAAFRCQSCSNLFLLSLSLLCF